MITSGKITWEDVTATAARLGFEVERNGSEIKAWKKAYPHVNKTFDTTETFTLAPKRSEDFALLNLYYWIRGYTIDYGIDGKVELHLGMRHPQFQPQVWVAETWDYSDHWRFGVLVRDMADWVAKIEGTGGA